MSEVGSEGFCGFPRCLAGVPLKARQAGETGMKLRSNAIEGASWEVKM